MSDVPLDDFDEENPGAGPVEQELGERMADADHYWRPVMVKTGDGRPVED